MLREDVLVDLRTGGGKFIIAALAVLFCGMGIACINCPTNELMVQHHQSLIDLGIPTQNIVILKRENYKEVVERLQKLAF